MVREEQTTQEPLDSTPIRERHPITPPRATHPVSHELSLSEDLPRHKALLTELQQHPPVSSPPWHHGHMQQAPLSVVYPRPSACQPRSP